MTARTRQDEAQALDRVRRRVAAIGFFAVASHGVVALIGVSYVLLDQDRRSDAIPLLVMSGLIALIVCGVTRAILGHKPFSWQWSALALAPTVAAMIYLL